MPKWIRVTVYGIFSALAIALTSVVALSIDQPVGAPSIVAPLVPVLAPAPDLAAGTSSIRAAVVGPSGGIMASAGYSASVTLGEPFVSSVMTSANYTACIGFQCIGNRVPVSGFAWLPIISGKSPMPTPTPTPTATPMPCDAFEPNDSRSAVVGGLVTSGVSYTAKLCSGDPEDNYRVQKSSAGTLTLNLTLPNSLVGHTVYFVYSTSDFANNIPTCSGSGGTINSTFFSGNCTGLSTGGYVVRLYTDSPSVFDNNNSYTFSITY